jgi:Fe2+ transport system protein B
LATKPIEITILKTREEIMAKRKKHNKKRNKHKPNVAKNTTSKPIVATETSNQAEIIKDETAKKPEATPKKNDWELKDVKYSLILFGLIILAFAILFVILQNQSVSNYFYGFIKITK